MTAATLVIGIGNRFRGDDALGCRVADELRESAPANADIIEHDGEPAALIDCWQGRQWVILIDAVSSGAGPGTIHHFDLRAQALPGGFRAFSTHAFGIAEAIELARVLEKLPPRLEFYGVEGKSFAAASQLSEELKAAAMELRRLILKRLWEESTHASVFPVPAHIPPCSNESTRQLWQWII
jgi:hydrogenase maturation protease